MFWALAQDPLQPKKQARQKVYRQNKVIFVSAKSKIWIKIWFLENDDPRCDLSSQSHFENFWVKFVLGK
jgi:hypothetical protein